MFKGVGVLESIFRDIFRCEVSCFIYVCAGR